MMILWKRRLSPQHNINKELPLNRRLFSYPPVRQFSITLLLWFIISPPGTPTVPQESFSPDFLKTLQTSFSLDFPQARKQANALLSNSRNGHLYLMSYIDFLESFITNDSSTTANFLNNFSSRVSNFKENSALDTYLLTDMYLQKGIVELSTNNSLSAAWAFHKAHKLWKSNTNKHPSFHPIKKQTATFNLLLGNLSGYTGTIANTLGYTGNTELGLKQLKEYFDNQKKETLKREAFLYFGYAQLKFGTEHQSFLQQQENRTAKKSSPLETFLLAQLALKNNNSALCLSILTQCPPSFFQRLPLLYYLQGKAKACQLNPDCSKDLIKFLNTNGHNFKASAMILMSHFSLMSNNKNEQELWRTKIINLNSYPTAQDKQAYREINSPHMPDSSLVAARLLFDGGNFALAQKKLLKNRTRLQSHNYYAPEFYYRLARIYDRQGNIGIALENYQKTIDLSNSDSRYFGPYAAIYSAYIHEKNHTPKKAKLLFKTALELNTGEYSYTIDQIANNGIERQNNTQ